MPAAAARARSPSRRSAATPAPEPTTPAPEPTTPPTAAAAAAAPTARSKDHSGWRYSLRAAAAVRWLVLVTVWALCGTTLGVLDGGSVRPASLLVVVAVVLFQCTTGAQINEVYDIAGDRINAQVTEQFSGGTGKLLAAPHEFVVDAATGAGSFALVSPLIALVAGVALDGAFLTPTVVGLVLCNLLYLWFYSAPPLSLSRTLLCEPLVNFGDSFCGIGLAGVVATGGVFGPHLFAFCSIFALRNAKFLLNIPDREADRAVGKNNVTSRLTRTGAVRLSTALLVAQLALLAALAAGRVFAGVSVAGVVVLPFVLTLPLNVIALRGASQGTDAGDNQCARASLYHMLLVTAAVVGVGALALASPRVLAALTW